MQSLKVKDLFPPLRRPEYPSSPEIFLTSLAWNRYGFEDLESGYRLKYMRQQKTTNKTSKGGKKVDFSHDRLSDSTSSLRFRLASNGFSDGFRGGNESVTRDLVDAILDGISSTSSLHSDYIAVSPMTPALAMLQNVIGMKGTDANFAGIMQDLASMGGFAGDLSESWILATEQIMSANPHLRAIDLSIQESIGFGQRVDRSQTFASREWAVLSHFPEYARLTPFNWFARNWSNLTNEEWTRALPPRLWTDWANAIMRTGFGMAYLWEASWYHKVSTTILDSDLDFNNFERLMSSQLIPWLSSEVSISLRAVKGQLEQRVRSGSEISRVIRKFAEDTQSMDLNLSEFLTKARASQSFLLALQNASNKPTSSHKSTSEAIFYSLNTRREVGAGADYYGLLRYQSRRYLVPNPGTEWLAAISSLVSSSPKVKINLGQLLEELASLGLSPPLRELVSLLEQAGLARGSADSDSGMEIETAF